MRYFTQFFILSMISAACCCSKGGEAGGSSTEPEAPRALTVTPTSIEATPEAKTQEITIEAPARPKVEIPSAAQSWVSYEDGVFNKYKMTIKLKLAANETHESRSAEVSRILCFPATVPSPAPWSWALAGTWATTLMPMLMA